MEYHSVRLLVSKFVGSRRPQSDQIRRRGSIKNVDSQSQRFRLGTVPDRLSLSRTQWKCGQWALLPWPRPDERRRRSEVASSRGGGTRGRAGDSGAPTHACATNPLRCTRGCGRHEHKKGFACLCASPSFEMAGNDGLGKDGVGLSTVARGHGKKRSAQLRVEVSKVLVPLGRSEPRAHHEFLSLLRLLIR